MSTTATDSVKLGRAFAVEFCRIDRWGAASFREVEWSWPKEVLHPMSYGLTSRVDAGPKTAPLAEVPIIEKISFCGQVTLLDKQYRAKYKGRLFWANAGDVVYSKIRAKQGSMAVVPTSIEKVAVRKYYSGRPVIERIERISRPGLRVYRGTDELPRVMNGLGVANVSTPRGVITDRKARAEKVGGEVLCIVA